MLKPRLRSPAARCASASCVAALCAFALFGLTPLARARREHGLASKAQSQPPVLDATRAAIGQDDSAPARPRDEQARRAFLRGLDYLAAEQRAHQDGSFPLAGGHQHAPVALAALGALAFMAEGSTPDRGPYGAQVSAAIDYLLSKADASASSARGYIAVSLEDKWGMHAHGYAVLALCNAFTLSPARERGKRIAELLPDAVAVIQSSQTSEGGWFYTPVAGLEHENSVTVVQLQALRAARNCGLIVKPGVVAKAIDYIRRCQSESGSFRYALEPSAKTSLALTAAGLATLQNAGHYAGPEIDLAVREMWAELVERGRAGFRNGANFPHYERLYVALALWTHSDHRMFESWSRDERQLVLAEQRPDGSWPDDQFGACYATAMNALFLSIEDALLPLFER